MATVEELQALERENLNGHDPEGEVEGQSIEEIAENGGLPEEDPTPVIAGSTESLTLSAGGRKPDTAVFKVKSAQVKLREKTQFSKGETVRLDMLARIDDVQFPDTHDEYGSVVSTKRVHISKPLTVERWDARTQLEAATMELVESGMSADEITEIVRSALDSE